MAAELDRSPSAAPVAHDSMSGSCGTGHGEQNEDPEIGDLRLPTGSESIMW